MTIDSSAGRAGFAVAERPLDRLLPVAGWAGLGIFLLFNLVVVALVLVDPERRSVVPVYRLGALGWWRGEDIFGGGIAGFLYLPSFAVLYTPFALLGASLGDALWRVVSVGLLAYAIWWSVGLLLPAVAGRRKWLVLGACLLLLEPSGFSAFRNGQATVLLMALLMLGSVAIVEERWWRSALFLGLAFAIKPLALVLMLLVGVLYPKLGWRLVVVTIGFLLLPFVNPDPAGVVDLYRLGIAKILAAGDPGDGRWADLTGLLNALGISLSDRVLTGIRLVFALLSLGLAFVALRRTGRDAPFHILAIAVVYLMLFNPRTESNTYVMFGCVVAIYAAVLWHRERRAAESWFMVGLSVAFVVAIATYPYTTLWLKPLLCLAFIPFLAWRCWTPPVERTLPA
ncbi:glycosyltransferase family 87 protein [Kaistia adipata]|uniref:glycosyltransferase family 87 protein n=1 Tax=Kaistia adipata TaxID=166954 RepID=UPI000408743F|nr:glycosyltransferase family 87 protein [Kaistia adipata]